MTKDGVVPPQGGPSRRPAGGPENQPGAATWGGGTPERGLNTGDGARAPVRGRKSGALSGAGSGVDGSSIGGSGIGGGAMNGGAAEAADLGGLPDLATALRTRVATVGVAGPPPGGLAVIRRKARTRQRNRAVLAGSAGILALAVGVTVATGDRFDLMPALSGAVGLGGDGSSSGGQSGSGGSGHLSAAANGGHVAWPTGAIGKTGLAIGPVAPVTSTPSAVAASKLPLCTAQTVKAATTIGPVAPVTSTPSAVAASKLPLCTAQTVKAATTIGPTLGGVVYAVVNAVAQSSCVAVGPPVLTVANQAGTASSSVTILKADSSAAPQLPSVPTWGRAMVLNAGQSYQFQFAWNPTGCAQQSSASPVPSASAGSGSSTYYLGYAVTGTVPTAVVTLSADCGAHVYVTDIYATGAFPLPKVPTTTPADSTTPAAPASSPAPSTGSSTTPPQDSSSATPSESTDPANGVVNTGDATPSG